MSLNECRVSCSEFIRKSLPLFKDIEKKLSQIPSFHAEIDSKNNRLRFIERKEPNWWAIPMTTWSKAFRTKYWKDFSAHIVRTSPLVNAIGKWVIIPETGRGTSYPSAAALGATFTRAYLIAAGSGKWKPKKFDLIWRQCLEYFDPEIEDFTYVLYAPICGFSANRARIALGDGLDIRRLTPNQLAKIATLNTGLAGVTFEHRLTLWPRFFFVKEFKFQKKFLTEEQNRELSPKSFARNMDCTAWLNEEVVMLRAFLDHRATIPNYEFIIDGYSHDTSGGTLNSMIWRPQLSFSDEPLSKQQLSIYVTLREQFGSLRDRAGWARVAGSMRRFAVAWENPFPADTLADIVAALESLLVGDKQEVSYKLRVRAAQFLAQDQEERQKIFDDVKLGYAYRSKIYHVAFVLDNAKEASAARARNRARVKRGKQFHDVNQIRRLTYSLAAYYKTALRKIVRSGNLEIEWAEQGL